MFVVSVCQTVCLSVCHSAAAHAMYAACAGSFCAVFAKCLWPFVIIVNRCIDVRLCVYVILCAVDGIIPVHNTSGFRDWGTLHVRWTHPLLPIGTSNPLLCCFLKSLFAIIMAARWSSNLCQKLFRNGCIEFALRFSPQGDRGPHLITMFLGPPRVYTPDRISIRSAVFASHRQTDTPRYKIINRNRSHQTHEMQL